MFVFISFNYLTLCKTLKYINEKCGVQNSLIVYTEEVQPMPDRIKRDYNTLCIEKTADCQTGEGALSNVIKTAKNCKKFSDIVCDALKKIDGNITMVVFKDNFERESVMIDRVFKKFKNRVSLVIMEEGLGIYQTQRRLSGGLQNKLKISLKKLIFKFMGCSTYSLKGFAQGCHPKLGMVIVGNPCQVKEKYKDRDIVIEKEIEIFDVSLCKYFVEAVLDETPDVRGYDYVYLSMPIKEAIGPRGGKWNEHYDEFLTKTLDIVSKKGKVLIKCHPRDSFNYDGYLNENVGICSLEQNRIPFECLYTYLGKPQILTPYSSCVTGVNPDKPSLFLYNLLDIKSLDFVNENFLKENNVTDCKTYEQLEEII